MKYDDLLELVQKRRSIRKFLSDPIPDEYIDQIIEVARWAPSGFHTQPWEFMVIKDEKLKNELVDIIDEGGKIMSKRFSGKAKDMPANAFEVEKKLGWGMSPTEFIRMAPVFILLYGDPRTGAGLPFHAPPIDPKSEIVQYELDASLAGAYMYMSLAATSLGLASQRWTSVRAEPMDSMVKELLGIPKEFSCFESFILGYPGAVPRAKPLRPLEKMVHVDKCGPEDFRTDEEVHDFAKKTKSWAIVQHQREQRK